MWGEMVEDRSMEKKRRGVWMEGSKIGTKSRRKKRHRLNSRIEVVKLEEEWRLM
jgi:hypothetical protein